MGILTHLKDIVCCEEIKCNEAEVIPQKVINALHRYLTESLVYTHREPFRLGGRRNRQLSNIKHNNFLQYKMFADEYVNHVLHKEAITHCHQKKTGCPYEVAKTRNMASEADINKEIT